MISFIQRIPPRPPNHPACNTKNPPWWCDNTPTLDITTDILLVIAIIYGVYIIYNKYYKNK